ncbi:hypothetical protein M422DRAFT_784549 [Sphaerobolus stellatus SS14]|uniref:Uncharacterized protein n=1 Tax=Sphaerobolus stellatus (strain SS14) TaxID=990650 RepID=A0A0C9UI02_SPHS4|nr:hypothetical protein M422DRAFT_784549 [Sphaerobolus stellatus SS14]
MNSPLYTNILIVGAGPAGLMLAVCLKRLGIDFKIIDKRIPGQLYGQADGIQPRTIELWESLGIAGELLNRGTRVCRSALFVPDEANKNVQLIADGPNVALPEARYPFEILAPVQLIEGIMRDTLTSQGVIIEQPMEPVSVRVIEKEKSPLIEIRLAPVVNQHGDTDIQEIHNTSETIITAKYVIGCDGARSWVRKAMGIEMKGDETIFEWGVMDFTPVTNLPTFRAKTVIQSPLAPFIGYLPRPNRTARIYTLLGRTGSNIIMKSEEGAETSDLIVKATKVGFLPYTMEYQDISWASIYRVKQMIATQYSAQDCVFLVGDACHVHSPLGGQGANVSMADAYNLGWKLAAVLKGQAEASLLKTYEDERRPIALDLLSLDKEIFKCFDSELHFDGLALGGVYMGNAPFLSGLGITYNSSLIKSGNEDLAPGLKLGYRFPSAEILRHCDWNAVHTHDLIQYDGNFKLILLPGDIQNPEVESALIELLFEMDNSELRGHLKVLRDFKTIFRVPRTASLPAFGHSSWLYENCYVDENEAQELHGIYALADVSPYKGVAVLVRPDGYVCTLMPISTETVSLTKAYFDTL